MFNLSAFPKRRITELSLPLVLSLALSLAMQLLVRADQPVCACDCRTGNSADIGNIAEVV